jgi:hypothetical protein
MRVWDADPGYLNRQSLLGEHREIHAILSIVTKDRISNKSSERKDTNEH